MQNLKLQDKKTAIKLKMAYVNSRFLFNIIILNQVVGPILRRSNSFNSFKGIIKR